MQPRRVIAILAVIAAFGSGLAFGLLTRDDGATGSTDGAIDWSQPSELPRPETEDVRSEFVDDQQGYRFFPRSGRALPSEPYRFDTGHCGLGHLLDFDGSFWAPVEGSLISGRLLDDQDLGAIALIDFDRALYRSSDGIEIALERITGPVITQPCE